MSADDIFFVPAPVPASTPRPQPGLPRRRFAVAGLAAATMPFASPEAGAGESATVVEPAAAGRPDGVGAVPANGPLAEYVRAADPARRCEPMAEGAFDGGTWRTARLVSQRWRGVDWTHELSICVPDQVDQVHDSRGMPMLLWIDGGTANQVPFAAGGRSETGPSETVKRLAAAAKAAGLPAAVLRQVPYQPMFAGLAEDGLIAHSFVEYARTGDPTWPLLLPMVKAAVAGMDAATDIVRDEHRLDVRGFVVTGASKRGWTSWLTAAVDTRVVGIVPQVIDMLSMDRHLRLQVQSFGGLSEKLDDYSSRGVEKLLDTPRGRDLIDIVDPYAYRDRLTSPKLISLGTNDPYWPLGSLDLYRDGLPGPCWVSYCPNAGHGIPMERWGGLVVGMARHASGVEPLPDLHWRFAAPDQPAACALQATGTPARVVLWQAGSDTRDFRRASWRATPVAGGGPEWTVPLETGASRWSAALIEVHYPRKPMPLVLTTSVQVRERKA